MNINVGATTIETAEKFKKKDLELQLQKGDKKSNQGSSMTVMNAVDLPPQIVVKERSESAR